MLKFFIISSKIRFPLIQLFSFIFVLSFLFSPAFAQGESCKSLFAQSREDEIFYKMENRNEAYVKFNLNDLGELQAYSLPGSIARLKNEEKNPLKGTKKVKRFSLKKTVFYKSSYIEKVLRKYGHESLHFINDSRSGLRAIIAIHNTKLGQGAADGGTRIKTYESEEEAFRDALRLSEGMSYKAALADLPIGGAKAVIYLSSEQGKTEEMLEAYGFYLALINRLHKRFVKGDKPLFSTGEDVGVTPRDLRIMNSGPARGYIIGIPHEETGQGDPSILTAQGVVEGIKAAVKHAMNKDSLEGLSFAVQGLGNVGGRVAALLAEEKGLVSIFDIDSGRVEALAGKPNIKAVSAEEIISGKHDVFVPCALGCVINADTINKFQVKIIAGSANNQLESPEYGDILKEKNILYAPDFIINSGGLISVFTDHMSHNKSEAERQKWADKKIRNIYHILAAIFKQADQRGLSPSEAADRIAKGLTAKER